MDVPGLAKLNFKTMPINKSMIQNRNPGLNRKSKGGVKGKHGRDMQFIFPIILTDLRASNFDPL